MFRSIAITTTLISLSSLCYAQTPDRVSPKSARGQASVLYSESGKKYEEEWGYAGAIISGDTIYISGVVSGLREGETDLEAGYDRAFKRIGELLVKAGVTWDDVVDITSYHTDLTSQMPAIIKVKHQYIKAPFPAWTAVGVTRLIPDRGLTEIKIVARKPKQ